MPMSQDAAFLAAVVKGALDGIVSIDERGRILSFNPAATKLFGYAPEEMLGQGVAVLMPEPYRGEHESYLRNYLKTGEAKIIGIGRQVEGRRKDGSIFPADLGVTEIQIDGRRLFIGVIHDLSERRRFEAHLRELHTDRLDLIEHMSVGLAHELKQPLVAINAYLNVLRRHLKEQQIPAEKGLDVLDKITQQMFRVSEIMDNVRQFMTRGSTDKTPHHLNDVVRTACEFTDAIAKEAGVTTTVRLDAKDDLVFINKVQIQQVVVNLKRNAIEAMHGCQTREMIVSTRPVEGDMIRVDVADTGCGLAEAVRSRLFEPFATTKPHGLGIGLSISRSIIEDHHGKLWAEDTAGGRTLFSFVLPVTRA
ncbi:MAG: two-component system sensor histidine kinase NtrB [Methylocystis sp.]|uniref:two-component system sensor histidine kinase NtrB n=1 Tax=Methylocystis sp. TaxID=1911079 RepID=UPI003DA4153E